MVEALGCHGELVRTPGDLKPALARAFEAGAPALVWRKLVADTETPVGAALKLIEPGRGDFLLESVAGGAVRGWRSGRRAGGARAGVRGAVAIFLASIPMLGGLSKAYLYFDVAFVVVVTSLLLQGWTLGPAARWLHVALPRVDRGPRRVELDLPGQLEQLVLGAGHGGRVGIDAGR